MQGVYAATDYWWTLEDKFPLAKMFIAAFEKKYGYKPEWGAENAYMSVRASGRAWVERRAASIRRMSSRSTRRTRSSTRLVGDVHYRKEDHQRVRPVIIVKGKLQKDMKGKEDYYDIVEVVPGEP